MRIGLFTDTYLPTVNGISYVVDSTRRQLEKLGHDVYIFAPKPAFRYKETDPSIIRYPAVKGITFEENFISVYFPPRQVRKIRTLNLDVIHFFTPNQLGLLGLYVGITSKIPLVGQYCTDIYQYASYYPQVLASLMWLPAAIPVVSKYPRQHWFSVMKKLSQKSAGEKVLQRVAGQVMRVVHDQCQLIIAPSKKMVAQLKTFGINAPIKLLPNGSDALANNREVSAALRAKYKLAPKDKLVLYVGRLAKEKNIELLINAFNIVAAVEANAKLIICGDFDYRPQLEAVAAKSPYASKIIFTGVIEHSKLGALYHIGSVFAFPSLTDTQGLVLHEAAHAGLPIVMIDTTLSEVFKPGENGLLSKPNAADFAKQLRLILSDSVLRERMGKASIKLAARFSEAGQVRKLAEHYRKITQA